MVLKVRLDFGILLILIVNESTLLAQNPPVISKFVNGDISNHALQLKTDISLTCDGRGTPDPEYKWFHDDEEIVEVEGSGEATDWGRILTNENQVITFSEVKDEYIGWYYCEAENEHGKARSEQIYINNKQNEQGTKDSTLIPKVNPPLNGSPGNYVPYFKTNYTLSCDAENDQESNTVVSWTQDGIAIEDNKVYKDGYSLAIRSFDDSSIGNYACNVSNEYGYAYHNVYLGIATQKPSFVEDPLSSETFTGQTINLQCRVRGYPLPEIIWKFKSKDGEEYTDVSVIQKQCKNIQVQLGKTINCKELTITRTLEESVVISDLKIESVAVADSGNYHCEAHNNKTEISVDAVITVYPKTNIKDGHIWIQNGEIIPNAENVMAGGNLTMVCNVENYATWKNEFQGSIGWMKEGKDVSSDDDSRFLLENNSFTITKLMQNDSGYYTCVASHSPALSLIPDVATMTDTLTVQYQPTQIVFPPEIPPTICWVKQKNIDINCIASGIPRPTLAWYKDSNDLEENYTLSTRGQDNLATLKLSNITSQYDSVYRCEASAGVEVVRREVNVKVISDDPEENKWEFQENASLNFSCFSECENPSLHRVWYFNDARLPESSCHSETDSCDDGSGFRISPDTRYLTLKNINKNRIGRYECEVKSQEGERLMTAHHLLGTSPKVHRKKQEDVIVLEGNTVQLTCNITGNPSPNIIWHMPNLTELSIPDLFLSVADPRMSVDEINHTLTIRNVGRNDSGIYRCFGVNMLGDISTEVELKVGKHCSPKPSSNHKEYEEEKSFTFTCDINIDPVLQEITDVYWKKDDNGDICNEPNIECQELTRFSSSSMTITGASEKDVGRYTCFAQNSLEKCSLNNTLYKLNDVSKEVTNVKFEKGKNKTFNCNIEIQPENLGEEGVSWIYSQYGRRKNKLKCNKTVPDCGHKTIFNKDNSLTITDPDFENVGIYTCKVKSVSGRESITKTNYFPELIQHNVTNNQYFVERSNFQFGCTFEIHPALEVNTTVTWIKDNITLNVIPLDDPESYTKYSAKFNIKHSIPTATEQDIGRYSCVVNTGIQNISVQHYNLYPSIKHLNTSFHHVYKEGKLQLNCTLQVPDSVKSVLIVNWYKDGEKMDISRWKSTKNEEGDYSMTINPLLETEFGEYVCIVSLPLFDEKSQIQHRVYKETIIHSENRVAEIDRYKNNADENDDVTFDCESEVTSRLKKTVEWMHNSTKITDEDTYDNCGDAMDDEGKWMLKNEVCKYFIHENNSLTIFNLTEEDIGNATCTVTTELGNAATLTHIIAYKEEHEKREWTFLVIGRILLPVVVLFVSLVIIALFYRRLCYRRSAFGEWSPVNDLPDESCEKLPVFYKQNENSDDQERVTPSTPSTTSASPSLLKRCSRISDDSLILFIDDSRRSSINLSPGDRARTLDRKKKKITVNDTNSIQL